MSKHRLTGTLFKGESKEVLKEFDDEFFSIYNATAKKNHLEFLGYKNIELKPSDKVTIYNNQDI